MAADPELTERIEGLIRGALNVEVPSPGTDLIETGLLDSLALVSLIAEIEQQFGFELPLDEFDVERFRTVDRIAELVGAEAPAAGGA
jgi:D-alanine--poly(phosphoribitol) ligase subunit 2